MLSHAELIQEIVRKRDINYLVHFTRESNVSSILNHGLIPRLHLIEKNIPFALNDEIRLDGSLDASCMSISFPNYKMFYRYRCLYPNVSWVVLAYKSSILWNFDCAFCHENAASNNTRAIPFAERHTATALEDMFADRDRYPSRDTSKLTNNFPTHPQAEVLVYGIIPPDYIAGILCPDSDSANISTQKYPKVKCVPWPFGFSPRFDWELWQ